MHRRFLWALVVAVLFPMLAHADRLRVVSLNLHGYHPMGEAPRLWQNREGRSEPAEAYLTYFQPAEILRGHERQLKSLAEAFAQLEPDLILLQEVGAGLPSSARECKEFLAPGFDQVGSNTAARLRLRLEAKSLHYNTALACRGNIGWRTYPDTFREGRVLRADTKEIVHDFDSNPYPNGFLVEGLAVLARAPWRMEEARSWRVSVPGTDEDFFFQSVKLHRASRWWLVVNLHAGWRLRHFEQALAVRESLYAYLNAQSDAPSGVIVGGDFNAELFAGGEGDIETTPWHASREISPGLLESRLWSRLLDKQGFYIGGYGDEAAAQSRVRQAVERFSELLQTGSLEPLVEAVSHGQKKGICLKKGLSVPAACETKERIDLIFLSQPSSVRGTAVLWPQNSFYDTRGISDHPGILVDLRTD